MNIYKIFSFKQLRIVLTQNPNDLEAKKQLELIKSNALNSNDILFYIGPILILVSILMAVTESGTIPLSYIPVATLGLATTGLNIDNYLLKKL